MDLRIWLIKEGEPLPSDKIGDRLFRMGLIAETLVKMGHDVVWWSSTFNHAKKILRFNEDRNLELAPNYRLKLLHSIPYKKKHFAESRFSSMADSQKICTTSTNA